MSWIDEREQLDADIPEAWNLFCIAIEQTAEQFGVTAFARAEKVFAAAKRINSCVHVVVAPIGQSSGKALDICLDRIRRRIFSKDNEKELESLRLERGRDGNTCLVDSHGKAVSVDRATEIFLRRFLFGEDYDVE